uniref:Filamin-A n=1 Tax=Syphacia muris TaxID=451379 RepID=A0A158R5Z9_9BILA
MSLNSAKEDKKGNNEKQPDLRWIKIQQNTFTRWVNQKLQCVDIQISDLETDFEDGLKLIRLVEVLSAKSLGKYSRKVTFRSQKLENISLALNFLENVEKIKIVNIDSSAIADRNLKLILGLVWMLILHYSIAKQKWDQLPEEIPAELTPKQKLMAWIKAKIPAGLPLNNFTSDWNDGVLLGALVDSCVPDIHLDWREWVPVNALESTRKAMQIATDRLNVGALITAEELINPAVDEKSVMTYLSQFPQANCRPVLGFVEQLDATPFVSSVTTFALCTNSGSTIPKILILGPASTSVEYDLEKETSTRYNIRYMPKEVGEHKIIIKLKDEATTNTEELPVQLVNAIKSATLYADSNAFIGKSAKFVIEGANDDNYKMIVANPEKQEDIVKLSRDGSSLIGEYVPAVAGTHTVSVTHNEKLISGTPYSVNVVPNVRFTVWGRGVVEDGIRVGDEVFFSADADIECNDQLKVTVLDPSGNSLPVTESVDDKRRRFTFGYKPQVVGKHSIQISHGDEPIEKSPFKVTVIERTLCAVRAFGPGVRNGVAKQPGVFYVETKGETDRLGFSIESPCKTDILCTDNGNGSAIVQYSASFPPDEPGIYKVNIFSSDKHIKDSPFVFMVDLENEHIKPLAAKIVGLDSSSTLSPNEKIVFNVDTTACGEHVKPFINIYNADFIAIPITVTERSEGIYECTFQSQAAGKHYIDASINGIAIPNTPFAVHVNEAFDPSVIRLFGPGLSDSVRSKQPTQFTIDASEAGKGKVDVKITDSTKSPIDVCVTDRNDGTYTVDYVAPLPGVYEAVLFFNGNEIGKQTITVKPSVDSSSIRIKGLQDEKVLVGYQKEIRLEMERQLQPDEKLQVMIEDPDGQKYILKLNSESPTVYTGLWTGVKVGETKFSVLLDDVLVCSSKTIVCEGEDASKCRAVGEGLEKAIVNQNASFKIDTQGAGEGSVALTIKGPSESKTSITDHSNGSCTVEYLPLLPGTYEIAITFGKKKEQIPGSPFIVKADYPNDPTQIEIRDFLEAASIGKQCSFIIDASRTAEAPIEVRFGNGQGQPVVEEVESRLFKVSFTPSGAVGDMVPISILYDGKTILQKQFSLYHTPESELESVHLRDYTGGVCPADVVASLPAHFLIDVVEHGGGSRSPGVEVKGPDGKPRKSSINSTSDVGMYALHFTPDIIGVYDIIVYLDDNCISKTPFQVRAVPAGDASKCVVKDLQLFDYWAAGETKRFSVDVSEAGYGALNVLPSRENEVEYSVEQEVGTANQLVSITPLSTGPHIINLLFGGESIPNGTLRFELTPES